MRKILATFAAGLMIAGGAIVAAPAASAYPPGSNPSAGIVGSNRVAPKARVGLRAFNLQPNCTATLRVRTTKIKRVATVNANGQAAFGFRAPGTPGRYRVVVTQTVTGACGTGTTGARLTVMR